MTFTGALAGGVFGVSCHVLNNAVRKIPLSRYPWGHVGFFIGGAYLGSKYEGFEKQQLMDVNEMRADRGLPPLTGTEAIYSIKTEEKPKEVEPVPIGPKALEKNALGQLNKYLNNEMKTAKRMAEDNEVGPYCKYDEDELAENEVKFTQHFFKRMSEREDYSDAIREYCRKMSTATAGTFLIPPEGTTLEQVQEFRKEMMQKRIKTLGLDDKEKMAKVEEAYKAYEAKTGGKSVVKFDPAEFPEDVQDEMNRTGAHIKLQDYLNAKVEAFDKMSDEEKKAHLRGLFKSIKQWNSFTIEEKLHYSVPNFDELPYEEQKKLRKNMKASEAYSLPIFPGSDPDAEPQSSEFYKQLEETLKNKKDDAFKP